jgi:hypothetical protein
MHSFECGTRVGRERDESPATRQGQGQADLTGIEMMHLCLACYRGE